MWPDPAKMAVFEFCWPAKIPGGRSGQSHKIWPFWKNPKKALKNLSFWRKTGKFGIFLRIFSLKLASTFRKLSENPSKSPILSKIGNFWTTDIAENREIWPFWGVVWPFFRKYFTGQTWPFLRKFGRFSKN